MGMIEARARPTCYSVLNGARSLDLDIICNLDLGFGVWWDFWIFVEFVRLVRTHQVRIV